MQMKLEGGWLRDFAKWYTGAWCSQKASSVAEFFALNGTLSVNGAPAAGRNAITEVAQGFMTAFPDLELLMDDVVIQGDRAVYHWTFIGTNTGPGGTGHRVRFSGYEVWKFGEDGLIAESQGHFDAADYQRQLGGGNQKLEGRK
jgi:predicted ester cyclase